VGNFGYLGTKLREKEKRKKQRKKQKENYPPKALLRILVFLRYAQKLLNSLVSYPPIFAKIKGLGSICFFLVSGGSIGVLSSPNIPTSPQEKTLFL